MTECPTCHSDAGYYEKWIVSYLQMYTFTDMPDGTDEMGMGYAHGGKRKFCRNCGKDITKPLAAEQETKQPKEND